MSGSSRSGVDVSSERPLALRMRPELVVQSAPHGGRSRWRIKDPVALQYFELTDQEFSILQWLDGRNSLAEIRRLFEQRFAPMQLPLARLHGYLTQLHEEGLALATVSGQGSVLLDQARRTAAAEAVSRLMSLLAIRFRGIDPDRFLSAVYPALKWMFSTRFLAAGALVIVSAVLLVITRFDHVLSRLPDLPTFFTPGNLLWLAVSLAFIKVCHELGHAFCCKHFGGECHELGIMLLVFTPCLYCDVSDAWMLPHRRQRMAISAAGVMVELLLAAVATFLWWITAPGLFNSLCLNVMIVGSAGTLLINGNPLLRYDGYYLEEPNLYQQSSALLRQLAFRLLLGIDTPSVTGVSSRRYFRLLTYGVLSFAYRCFLLGAILWFCHSFLERRGFAALGELLATVTVAGVLYSPVHAAASVVRSPELRSAVRKRNLVLSLFAGLSGLALIAFVPIPRRVGADLVVEPVAMRSLFVSAPGRLVYAVAPGTAVHRGDIVGRLHNPDLLREIEVLSGERDGWEIHLANLESRRADDPEAASAIPAAREALAAADKQLRQRLLDAERLQIVAPVDGIVLPPPEIHEPSGRDRQLRFWQGTPLEPGNLETWLDFGVLFCQISVTPGIEAVALLNQEDVNDVQPGHRAKFVLDQFPGRVFHGVVREVAATTLDTIPRELAGRVPTRPTAYDPLRPADTLYLARIIPDEAEASAVIRTRGRAKILVEPVSIGTRLWRGFQQAFFFKS
jgi:putative peptide zinc metalloprotease protein